MNLRSLFWCLFLAHLYETSTSASLPAQEFDKLPCQIMQGHNGRDLNFFCPSIDLQNFTVEIKSGDLIKVICLARDVNLTSINVNVGPVDGFSSKGCNLVNQLRHIFALWHIESTKKWDINGFSNSDFVLRKDEFQNVDVSGVQSLHIEKSNIIEVEADTFLDFVSLKVVNLRLNKIKVLPDLFRNSKLVMFMDFAENRLESLPDQLTAPSLTTLQLWKNNLTYLNESVFTKAPLLKNVQLSINPIKSLPAKLLYPLPKLEAFSVSDNDISDIPEHFFAMNKNLEDIRLYGLNRPSIPENLFENLDNLTMIKLHTNTLDILPENLFRGLRELTSLYLSGNGLTSLSAGVFSDLENLEYLDLSDNNLTTWSNEISTNLKSLRTLILSGNNIETIDSDYFVSLKALKEFWLDGNGLSHIDVGAFEGFNLDVLDLSRNNLTNNGGYPTFIDGMQYSKKLLLDSNQFQSLPNIQLKTMYLSMSHNNIEELQLSDLMHVKEVHLDNNQIAMFNFEYVDVQLLLSERVSMAKVYVDSNPIDCGCSALNLIEFMDQTYAQKKIYEQFSFIGDLKCAGPAALVGMDVRQIKSQGFTCDYAEFFECPEECSCAIHPKFHSFNVSCNDLGLETLPQMPSFAPANYRHIFSVNEFAVNLSNNSISNFTERQADRGYANVTQLYLAHNKLNLVNWLPPRLEILELNGNRLQNLDYGAISVLNKTDTLKRLLLNDNDWLCNCKLLNLTKLIKSKILQVAEESRILCSNGERVIRMTEGVLCVLENQAALLAIGVCFFLFLVAIGVSLVLYYKYEYHVKVWLYSKRMLMRFVTEEDLDRDKMYDAFISYSHEDEEFVVKELIAELENGPEAYKLCVHIRDWIVGEFIAKQIADSVESSRRTIIVLSPHFLRSEWATMEFRTAHTQAMKEGRHRLIVIVYGDVDLAAVEDEDLRVYLSTNTYVKWGDPWFWKKLKYVLPHKRDAGFTNNNLQYHRDVKTKRTKNSRKIENIMVSIDKMDLINSPVTPNMGTPPAVSLDPLLIKANGNALDFKSAVPDFTNNESTLPAEDKLVTSTTNG